MLNTLWLLCNSVMGICFGVAMLQVMLQSRPFRMEVISRASTFKAAGTGAISGLVFLIGVLLLSAVYRKAKPTPGEISVNVILMRALIGTLIGGAAGATFYVPLLGNLAVLFLDYHGVVLYFTGAIGGCIGALIGAVSSTQSVDLWIRIPVILGAGLGGIVIGFVLGQLFITLFTAPFIK